MNTYCQDCVHYPCPDYEPDTEIFDCDYKEGGNKMRELLKEDLHHVVASLPKDVIELIKKYPSLMVAGGFVRSVIAEERISDIDLFGDKIETLKQVAQELTISRKGRMHETTNAITVLAPPRMPIQFITRWTYPQTADLINSFDFSICQTTVNYFDGKWYGWCGDRFYEDLAARRLYYTNPIREEEVGGSLLRVRKFLMKGYTIQAWSLGMVVARLVSKIDVEKLGGHDVGTIIVGLLREVDPLRVVDGIEMRDEHENLL